MVVLGIVMLGLYAGAAVVLVYGMLRPHPAPAQLQSLPHVSVLVTARNEEVDLPGCIAALENLNYPREKLQVILVDDRSTDGTAALQQQAAARHPHFQALSTNGQYEQLQAKSRGIAVAADAATGDWFFITDADSRVPADWVHGLLRSAHSDVGVLGGPFIALPTGIAGGIEAATEAYLMGIAYAVSGLGGAPIASGPNMAIRRSIYQSAGGLASAQAHIAEDMALLKMALDQGYVCRGLAAPDTTVRVTPVGTWRGVLQQEKRWLIGALQDSPALIQLLAVTIAAFACVGSLLTLLLWVWHPVEGILIASLRATTDIALAVPILQRTRVRGVARWTPLMILHFLVGYLILPLWVLAAPTARWQGQAWDEKLGKQ